MPSIRRRHSHDKNSKLLLRKPSSHLRGRTPKSIALPLPLLPEAHRQHLRHRRLLSSPGRHRAWPLQPLYAAGRQRFSRDLPLLPRLRLDGVWKPERLPDVTAVASGAFADPAFPKPANAVHLESRHRGSAIYKGDCGGRPPAHPRRDPLRAASASAQQYNEKPRRFSQHAHSPATGSGTTSQRSCWRPACPAF
jgi:hypothetical protein